jgi:hypothetical protein
VVVAVDLALAVAVELVDSAQMLVVRHLAVAHQPRLRSMQKPILTTRLQWVVVVVVPLAIEEQMEATLYLAQ